MSWAILFRVIHAQIHLLTALKRNSIFPHSTTVKILIQASTDTRSKLYSHILAWHLILCILRKNRGLLFAGKNVTAPTLIAQCAVCLHIMYSPPAVLN